MKTVPATPVRAAARVLAGPFMLLMLCAGMAACSQQPVGAGVPVAIPQVMVPSVPPVASSPSLEVLDASLNLSVLGGELRIRSSKLRNVWLRVRLPSGNISPLTLSPDCQCIQLGAAQPLGVRLVPGLSIETALAQGGPWTVAARTH